MLDVQKIVFLRSEKQLEIPASNMKQLITNQVLHIFISLHPGVKLSLDSLRILKSRKIWIKKNLNKRIA